ncbi:hypothetical protein WAX74_15330 [Psychrobacillus sp. FJAT-51614]|uniref:Uncharacterized protein n=1 Tax=Psychrobacillus mangrovi TaxID=3117745 RepID=A0ABU8F890_9BACI
MISVDKVLDNHSKRQKYLGLRVILIMLLVIFGLDTLYETESINNELFFNTLLLLFAPIFLEYLFGMDTYSGYTNTFRWVGLGISSTFVAVSFLGFMGKVELQLSESLYISELLLFNAIPILAILKTLSYTIIAITFFDYIFTFNKREKYYYKMIKSLEDFLEENYKELKAKGSLESRKNQFKEELLSNLNNKVEVEGSK